MLRWRTRLAAAKAALEREGISFEHVASGRTYLDRGPGGGRYHVVIDHLDVTLGTWRGSLEFRERELNSVWLARDIRDEADVVELLRQLQRRLGRPDRLPSATGDTDGEQLRARWRSRWTVLELVVIRNGDTAYVGQRWRSASASSSAGGS